MTGAPGNERSEGAGRRGAGPPPPSRPGASPVARSPLQGLPRVAGWTCPPVDVSPCHRVAVSTSPLVPGPNPSGSPPPVRWRPCDRSALVHSLRGSPGTARTELSTGLCACSHPGEEYVRVVAEPHRPYPTRIVSPGFRGVRSLLRWPQRGRSAPVRGPDEERDPRFAKGLWKTLCTDSLSRFARSAPCSEKKFGVFSAELSTGRGRILWTTLWTTCGQRRRACG